MNFRDLMEMENGFLEFRKLCESLGVDGSVEDWRMAANSWKVMDFEQRQEATKGMESRRGVPDDPVVKSLPQNILYGKKYQRKVREPATGSKQLTTAERIQRLKATQEAERGRSNGNRAVGTA